MNRNYIRSLGLPKGFPINEYANLAEIQADGGTDTLITAAINNYIHQKSGLVEGRDDLYTYIVDVLGFTPLMETVKVDGKDVEQPSETEGKLIARFVAELVKGTFTHKDFTVTGADADAKEASVWATLQEIVDAPRTVKIKDKEVKLFDLRNDIKTPIRTSKPKTPPAYAIAGAKSIFSDTAKDGTPKKDNLATRLKKWADTFTKEGITFTAFDKADDKGVVANDGNITNLAWAIQARELAQAEKKYA